MASFKDINNPNEVSSTVSELKFRYRPENIFLNWVQRGKVWNFKKKPNKPVLAYLFTTDTRMGTS